MLCVYCTKRIGVEIIGNRLRREIITLEQEQFNSFFKYTEAVCKHIVSENKLMQPFVFFGYIDDGELSIEYYPLLMATEEDKGLSIVFINGYTKKTNPDIVSLGAVVYVAEFDNITTEEMETIELEGIRNAYRRKQAIFVTSKSKEYVRTEYIIFGDTGSKIVFAEPQIADGPENEISNKFLKGIFVGGESSE